MITFWYAIWAPVYDWLLDRWFAFNRKKAIAYLNAKEGEHVIELGVGTGLNLPLYPPEVYVTGVDKSRAMLARAKKKGSDAFVKLRRADARRLPFPDGTFDKAFATFFFRVAPGDIEKEARRVLKKSGKLVVVDVFREDGGRFWDPFTWPLGWGRNLPDDLFADWKTEESVLIGKATRVLVLTIS